MLLRILYVWLLSYRWRNRQEFGESYFENVAQFVTTVFYSTRMHVARWRWTLNNHTQKHVKDHGQSYDYMLFGYSSAISQRLSSHMQMHSNQLTTSAEHTFQHHYSNTCLAVRSRVCLLCVCKQSAKQITLNDSNKHTHIHIRPDRSSPKMCCEGLHSKRDRKVCKDPAA